MNNNFIFRVDPRLVHATLMNVWVPSVGAKDIVICDDEIVENQRLRKIQELSSVGLVKVSFGSSASIKDLLQEYPSNASVIVLFRSLLGVEKAVEAGLNIEHLNIGHVPQRPETREVHPSVHLAPTDYELISQLKSKRIDVFVQPLPSDKRVCIARRALSTITSIPRTQSSTVTKKLRVVNERGLHLRAAHVFAHLAGRLSCKITILHPNGEVNAKSLLGLTTLGAVCGTFLKVRVEGPLAESEMHEIETLFAAGFNEGVSWIDTEEGAN